MTNQTDGQPEQVRRPSRALLVLTSVYGLFYLIFILISFIPGRIFGDVFGPEGSPVSSTMPFEPFDQEQIFVKLLFLLFLVGYLVVRKYEGIGGAIFILWYVAVWGVELLIVAPIKPDDWGATLIMGFPLFVFGILFVRHWYKSRKAEKVPISP